MAIEAKPTRMSPIVQAEASLLSNETMTVLVALLNRREEIVRDISGTLRLIDETAGDSDVEADLLDRAATLIADLRLLHSTLRLGGFWASEWAK
ncbi:hypothetical protein [Glacieibacterium frigidum]|uniref:Uncharacterized protein n=1 Tax=Glacieibacterium frigidum TaxID=2593303 RepID=A0A552U8F7_9SPHN|nr:hypothetical protein [Glacieibacterium frigidum]TRW14507.1 hypothetical protein FMM06_12440 [Glacieibacterium frigidum]